MNEQVDFERYLAAWLASDPATAADDQALDEIDIATRHARPLPHWLALIKEPPMRISARVAVGSPTVRLVTTFLTMVLLTTLATGAVVAGASFLDGEAKSARNGLIAFDSADGNIYVAEADGTLIGPFTQDDGEVYAPTFSPDGTMMAYLEADPGHGPSLKVEWTAHRAGASGSVLTTHGLRGASGIAWSPDSTQVAVGVLERDDTMETVERILLLDVTEKTERYLDLPSGLAAVDPAWSPDGRWLAFKGHDHLSGELGIYVVRPDGSELRRLDEGRLMPDASGDIEQFALASPRWSPDGSNIVTFCCVYPLEIWVLDADGSGALNVSGDSHDEFWPSWSPDGSSIAFQRRSPEGDEIVVVDADGGNPRTVDPPDGQSGNATLVWSPDGSAILTVNKLGTPEIVFLEGTPEPIDIVDPGGPHPVPPTGMSWQASP
jgi:Tol biopolymer transport system component